MENFLNAEQLMRIVGFVLLASLAYGQEQQHWKIQHDKSEMTDQSMVSIMTAAEGASDDAPFAALGIECSSGKRVQVAVATQGTDYQPAPTGVWNHFVCLRWNGHATASVRLRFDAKKPMNSDGWILVDSQTMLWCLSGKGTVQDLEKAKRLLVEYKTFTGQTRVLTFDMSGLREAIQQVPECKLN